MIMFHGQADIERGFSVIAIAISYENKQNYSFADDVFHCQECDSLFADSQVLVIHTKKKHGGYSIKMKFAF